MNSVTSAGMVAVTLLISLASLTVGSATVAAHRARTAADLGALAAAQVAVGEHAAAQSPCGAAADVVAKHRARLVWCSLSGTTVDVATAITVGLGLGEAQGRARAGPRDSEAQNMHP